MPLHITPLLDAIEQLAADARRHVRQERLAHARALLQELDAQALARRIAQARERVPWLVAIPEEAPPGAVYPPPALPANYTVIATDGSHIAPDRHSPVRYIVLNVGWAVLRYGSQPGADMGSRAWFWHREEDLHLEGTNGLFYPVEGARLAALMALHELDLLAAQARHESGPLVALRDGSLILWPLQNEDPAVQERLLPRIRRGLRAFHDMGIPVASYISYPGSRDLINSLRMWVCGHCRRDSECGHCPSCPQEAAEFCRWLRNQRDQWLLAECLRPGERSALFRSTSALQEGYVDPDGVDHRIYFFYVHTGTEIARVEMPAWVARSPDLRDLVHAVVVDQCRRGQGYPPVLQEAHEEAVISHADRATVEQLVAEALARSGVLYTRSAKDLSKRVRGV